MARNQGVSKLDFEDLEERLAPMRLHPVEPQDPPGHLPPEVPQYDPAASPRVVLQPLDGEPNGGVRMRVIRARLGLDRP